MRESIIRARRCGQKALNCEQRDCMVSSVPEPQINIAQFSKEKFNRIIKIEQTFLDLMIEDMFGGW